MNSSEEEELALFTFVLIDDESRAERKKKKKTSFLDTGDLHLQPLFCLCILSLICHKDKGIF